MITTAAIQVCIIFFVGGLENPLVSSEDAFATFVIIFWGVTRINFRLEDGGSMFPHLSGSRCIILIFIAQYIYN